MNVRQHNDYWNLSRAAVHLPARDAGAMQPRDDDRILAFSRGDGVIRIMDGGEEVVRLCVDRGEGD